MSDLTERLAAKLGRGECVNVDGERMVYLARAKYLLPLLLSEPELVASLSDEVRRGLLRDLVATQLDVAEEAPRNEYAVEVWQRALRLIAPGTADARALTLGGPVKIVRKVNSKGHTVAMWLGWDDDVWGWGELDGYDSADKRIADLGVGHGGWRISEGTAADCGTTLAALRDELTEEGKDGQ